MKKKINLLVYVGIVALVLTTACFLFPLGPGLIRTTEAGVYDAISGYSFIFGNRAMSNLYSTSPFIAAFTLLVIGAVFQVIAFIFTFIESSHKFSGFMYILGGLCVLVTGVLFIFTKSFNYLVPAGNNATLSLGWGNLIAGIAGIASGAISVAGGLLPYFAKKN